MLTGPMGAAAANPMKYAAKSTWMSEMIIVVLRVCGLSPEFLGDILTVKNIQLDASNGIARANVPEIFQAALTALTR